MLYLSWLLFVLFCGGIATRRLLTLLVGPAGANDPTRSFELPELLLCGLILLTTLASAVEQVERDLIQTALDRSSGNISEAARTLGLTRRGLYLKLRRLGLDSKSDLDT